MPNSKPSTVAALFVTRFNSTSGYELVWSQVADPALSFSGLEYLSLPSGIQNHEDSRLAIARQVDLKTYFGVCHFLRRVLGSHSAADPHIDRKNVHMYAIGVLCAPTSQTAKWVPETWTATGSEYLDAMEKVLLQFMNRGDWGDFHLFEDTFKQLVESPKQLVSIQPNSNHFLSYFVDLLETCGPLVFVLYKQALLRRRVLFFHNSDSDFYPTNSFNYLIALLLIVPQAAHILDATAISRASRPIYNIGLHDIDSELLKGDSYIATTSDDVLINYKALYDVAVIFPTSEHPVIRAISAHDLAPLRATRRDYTTFVHMASELGVGVNGSRRSKAMLGNISKSDVESLHGYNAGMGSKSPGTVTTDSSGLEAEPIQNFHGPATLNPQNADHPSEPNHISESLRPLIHKPSNSSHIAHVSLNNHPQWWDSLAEPTTWTELLWRAFSWFASAGEPADASEDSGLNTEDQPPPIVDTLLLITAIGLFHHQTRQYFSVLNQIIEDTISEQEDDASRNLLALNLSYQDLSEMGLDIHSPADAKFASDLVLEYYGHIVKTVTIGYGVCGVCS